MLNIPSKIPTILSRSISKCSTMLNTFCPRPTYDPMEVQRSELLNGIRVGAVKIQGAQMAACTVMYQAGSRYEEDDTLGATHFIRDCSDTSGFGYTAFSRARFLQQHGGYISCSSDRQSVSYTLTCPPDVFPDLKYYLLDTAARTCYNHWEIEAKKTIVREDLQRITPEQRVIDLVQRACWAGPLSNSVFCEEERIEGMSDLTLNNFVRNNFKSNRCSVGSVGIPFEETLKLAEKIEVSRENPPETPECMPYSRGGFETYDLGKGSDTWIAVAVPGCGTRDLPCLLQHAIIASACGTGNIQGGQHELDRTPQPPLGWMAGNDILTNYKAFNISYRDTGIIGIVAKTRACSAENVALSAAEFLKHVGDLDFKQIEVGKNRLKLGLSLQEDNAPLQAEDFAIQLASKVQFDNAKDVINMIDDIHSNEVCIVARGLSSKCYAMSFAVVGDIGSVPNDRILLICSK